MTGRDTDKQYEVNLQAHRSRTRFADYVDRVTGSAQTNDFYLVANNHFLDNPGTAALWADFNCDQRFLDAAIAAGRVFFWFGPAGTITPLHHDVSNILLVQVRGTKRVTLVPAQESHLVYNDIAVYSQVDADSVDLQQYPRFGNATKLTVDLRPAEALFIPVGWWHHVRGPSTSASACRSRTSLSPTSLTGHSRVSSANGGTRAAGGRTPMTGDVSISVIIPSKNEGGYLAVTVDGLLAGLQADGELIVIDNGSTDGSADAIRSDPAVRRTGP